MGLLLFSALAIRNVPPAAMLLAPVVLHRLQSAFPRTDQVTSGRERRLLAVLGGSVLAATLVGLPIRFLALDHLALTTPIKAAQHLANTPGDHYVLNSYNASGVLVFWGGPHTRVAVDGRSDKYGAEFIGEYEKMMAMDGDWRRLFDELRPNFALPKQTSPLVDELLSQGWKEELRDGQYVLLSSPAYERTGSTSHVGAYGGGDGRKAGQRVENSN